MKRCVAYEWKEIEYYNEGDINRVNTAFKKYCDTSQSRAIGNIKKRKIEEINGIIHNNGNNVGIIEFGDNIRFEFKTKLDSFWRFLPRMLHSLCNTKEFSKKIFIDPFQKISMPEGGNMVPLLALYFVILCKNALEKGMLKKYVRHQNTLGVIKGKIDLNTFSKTKPWDNSVIPCIYYDLTFDNKENQIVLWCLNKLIREASKIDIAQEKREPRILCLMRELFAIFDQEISLLPKEKSDIFGIHKSSLPKYYVELIKLCEVILSNAFFSFDKTKKQLNGVNFIIDMDWVFEQYMTNLFLDAAKEYDLCIENQFKQSLCDLGRISIRPDLVVFDSFDKKRQKPLSVIDFKWKEAPDSDNSNFYQIICYGLAEIQRYKLYDIDASLFYASGEEEMDYDIISKVFNSKTRLSINKICLNKEIFNRANDIDIEDEIKTRIRNYIAEIKGYK